MTLLSRGRFFAALAVALLLAPTVAHAQERGAWRVVEINGTASVTRAGIAPVALTSSAELLGGEQIQTEASGRVVLRRGNDTVIIAPNSAIALPARDTGLVTRILQSFGTVMVNVEKRRDPNFEVRTPFLAAIVKGTTFTVSADSISSAVHVVEGVVRVAAGAQAENVTAGQTARINTQSGGGLRIHNGGGRASGGASEASLNDRAQKARSAERQNGVMRIGAAIGAAPIDAGKASGGLVRNDGGPGAGRGPSGDKSVGRDGGHGVAAGNDQRGGPPSGLVRSAQANGNGHSGGNGGGNGNANAGGNGNGNGNGGAGGGNGNGNGNGGAGGGGAGGGGNGNGNGGGNGNGNGGG